MLLARILATDDVYSMYLGLACMLQWQERRKL